MDNLIIKEKNIIKDLKYYNDITNILKIDNIDIKNNYQYISNNKIITQLNNQLTDIHLLFKEKNICANCYLTNHTIDMCPRILFKNKLCDYCNKPFHNSDICPLKKQHINLSNQIDKFRNDGLHIPDYIWGKMDFLTKFKWVNYKNQYKINNTLFNNIVPMHIDLWKCMNDSDKNKYLTNIGVIYHQ